MTLTTIGGSARHHVEALQRKNRDTTGTTFRIGISLCLLLSLAVLAVLLFTVINDGWFHLTERLGAFLQGSLRSRSADESLGIKQGLFGSVWIGIFVAGIAFPTGIAAALYLEEYAHKSRFNTIIALAIRNLAGVPSVVYGLLGLFLFVERNTILGFIPLGWMADITGGRTVVSAGLILSILVLPIVIITSQEAIRAVPQGLKEGAYGVGATKSEMIRSQVLPYAAPGILTGSLLSMSRAIGEAAPLILIGATTGGLTRNPEIWEVEALRERFTALPIQIVTWVGQRGRDEGFFSAAAAGIVVLLVLVLALNMAAILMRNHFEKKRG
jgi:phosphate transport system permease protein